MVETVVVADAFEKVCRFKRDEPITPLEDGLRFGVFDGETAKITSADLFLSVGVKNRLVDKSEHLVGDLGAFDCDCWFADYSVFLFSGHVLSDGY